MNRACQTLLLVILSTMPGCVIPVPHTTEWAPALSGRVVDATTGEPIDGVRLHYAWTHGDEDDEPIESVTISADDGAFELPALKQRHWGYMFAVALNYPLPYPKWGREAWVSVDHPGYRSWSMQVDPMTVAFDYIEGINVELAPSP